MMKKVILLALSLVLSLSLLAGCGESAPDLTEVNNKYNQAADIFNEAAELANEKGLAEEPEFLEVHNSLADEIENIRVMLEDPEQTANIDVEATSAALDTLITAVQEYKDAIAATE